MTITRRACLQCGAGFRPKHGQQRMCSAACQEARKLSRQMNGRPDEHARARQIRHVFLVMTDFCQALQRHGHSRDALLTVVSSEFGEPFANVVRYALETRAAKSA